MMTKKAKKQSFLEIRTGQLRPNYPTRFAFGVQSHNSLEAIKKGMDDLDQWQY